MFVSNLFHLSIYFYLHSLITFILIIFISLPAFTENIIFTFPGIYSLYLPGGFRNGDSVMGASDCAGTFPFLHLKMRNFHLKQKVSQRNENYTFTKKH